MRWGAIGVQGFRRGKARGVTHERWQMSERAPLGRSCSLGPICECVIRSIVIHAIRSGSVRWRDEAHFDETREAG